MKFTKIIRLTISQEEYETLRKAETILQEICISFNSAECSDCPFNEQCKEKGSPENLLHHCINALEVED